jgi:single-strand DNA-binding protein
MWDRLAGLAESYLRKGSEISVEGKLTSRSYTDKEGIKRYVTEILVSDVQMLGKKP